jgi:RNA polymerase sigma-70 factor (ECF subfamily)
MSNQRVLLAGVEPTATDAMDADDVFRVRLDRSLAGGYRLAAVILGNVSDAEDATQDALVRAWRSRARLRDADRFDAWFQRIIVNACRDRLRRRKAGPRLLPIGARDDERSVVEDPAAVTAQRCALNGALAVLNADQRIAVVMRFYLDLEIDEIARRLDTSSGTIKSRLHRGLKQLRLAWEDEQ